MTFATLEDRYFDDLSLFTTARHYVPTHLKHDFQVRHSLSLSRFLTAQLPIILSSIHATEQSICEFPDDITRQNCSYF